MHNAAHLCEYFRHSWGRDGAVLFFIRILRYRSGNYILCICTIYSPLLCPSNISECIHYHFHNFDFSFNTELVQEHLEVFLHLYRVIFHLSDGEDAHLAILPGTVLLQQEWQEHQHATIVHNPPDVNVARNLKKLFVVQVSEYIL